MVLLGIVMSLAFKDVISFYRFRERGDEKEMDRKKERERMGDEERGGEMVT